MPRKERLLGGRGVGAEACSLLVKTVYGGKDPELRKMCRVMKFTEITLQKSVFLRY